MRNVAYIQLLKTIEDTMKGIKQYHLNKFNQSKLHFDVKDLEKYLEINKEKAIKPHRHSYYQVIWFKSSGSHYVDYKVVDHPENTLFVINKGQVHYFCPDSQNQGLLFHFNDIFIAQYDINLLDRLTTTIFSEMLPNSIALDQEDALRISAISQMVLEEWNNTQGRYGEMIYHLFSSILIYAERKLEQTSEFHTRSDEFVLALNFKRDITKNIHQFWGIDQFAERLGTSEKILIQATKAIFFETPSRYIVHIKILEAKRMLVRESLSIKQIAFKLGFDQATYFTKYFKKETGLTPREFRLGFA